MLCVEQDNSWIGTGGCSSKFFRAHYQPSMATRNLSRMGAHVGGAVNVRDIQIRSSCRVDERSSRRPLHSEGGSVISNSCLPKDNEGEHNHPHDY